MLIGFFLLGLPLPAFLMVTEYETVLVTAHAVAAVAKSPTATSSAIRRTVLLPPVAGLKVGTASPFQPATLNANGPRCGGGRFVRYTLTRSQLPAINTWRCWSR